ncbi:hypothetical protein L9W92_06360 [Pelotomaculum terephthalicicum JT]|uniref:hypothetical protein n=1 Tax=Pelotomaculum TaxID=191373 RepID=UPI0009CB3405|nr:MULTISPECIES: hypothetical protein [Pelotomaculum]MCG9967674.1 hypothetical protein [Pelotomaculum terephthalicicum JT]OPX84032.1 MAG: hypothetical protein A4E54_02997 [Pelotomaculum sp. PtaB.Bin117]OPY61494.1 MAG: hypothetical protein A4E56_02024 [Pelotomaculum sp. PtaU1.Bin065]
MIRFQCDCGNDDDQGGFDVYVSQIDLCDVLTVICRQCGCTKVEFVASNRDTITLFD